MDPFDVETRTGRANHTLIWDELYSPIWGNFGVSTKFTHVEAT